MFRVYDDRDPGVSLYECMNGFDCAAWIESHYDEMSDEYEHIFMENVK